MTKTTLSYLALATALLFASCKKSDTLSPNVAAVAASGTWHVSLVTNSGSDETISFAGQSFTFGSGNTITASKNTESKTGTWSVNSSSNKFNIDFGPRGSANLPFGELTDDWKILSASNTEIRLGDDNAASNQFLTFSKN